MRRSFVCAQVALAALAVISVSGCSSYKGINSLSLPGDVGTGKNTYQVTVEIENAANLVPNTPVYVNDINVGTVTHVQLKGWQPTLTLSLLDSVHLPGDAVAKLAQTSLLGSKHIELSAPASHPDAPPLTAGSTIPVDRTHAYPETEDLLSGVSLFLNGGGLQNAETITSELNKTLTGREDSIRDLLTQVDSFTTSLDRQKTDIVSSLNNLDRLGIALAPRMEVVDHALETLPAGFATVTDEEPELVGAVRTLGNAASSVEPLAGNGSDQLRGVFDEINPVLRGIANTQNGALVNDVKMLPGLIFPVDYFPYLIRGDFANAWVTVDLTNEALDKEFLTGTPGAGALARGTGVLKGRVPESLGPLRNLQRLPDPTGGLPLNKPDVTRPGLRPTPKIPGLGG